jgi:NADH-quinone oxidoreductase subunit D
LKEPGHFEFTVDGEIVTGATVRLGFVHRGIEKATESRNYTQNIYLLERVCGICSHAHGLAYVLGVEKLANVSAPPRAQAIRTLVAELERVHSHLLWLGVAAHEGGFDTLFMYSWRDREAVMDILEFLSGNRVQYSANLIGGVKYDVTDQQKGEILRHIDMLEERTRYYLKVVSTDETFLGRTRGIGTMTKEQAELLGSVGPTARSTGIERDIRVESPYAGYVDFPVQVKVGKTGDLQERFVVRMEELFECYRLIRELLDKMPAGDLTVKVPRRIAENEAVSRVEAPRGELFYYLKSNGTDMPERVKARTPSLCNWGTITSVAAGHRLADMPMILAGIDPCFSCNDRMITVRRGSNTLDWTWEDMRRYGIDFYRGRK